MEETAVYSVTKRDARGRFLPGNKAAVGGGGGRPRVERVESLNGVLLLIADEHTMQKWAASMQRKLERADPWATEFLFDRLLGKVPNKQEIGAMDGEPLTIIIEHVEVPVPEYQ